MARRLTPALSDTPIPAPLLSGDGIRHLDEHPFYSAFEDGPEVTILRGSRGWIEIFDEEGIKIGQLI